MTTSFSALGADNVHTSLQGLFGMLRRANHVHNQDTGLVKTLNSMLGRHTDSTNEQFRSMLDNQFNQFIEVTVSVVMVRSTSSTTDLRKREVDAEWQVWVTE
jgi:hypothetical protein